jgi:hypothetical protein
MTLKIAGEMGLEIGKDIIPVYSDYDLQVPGPKSDFAFDYFMKMKKDLSDSLGKDVPINISIQYHSTFNNPPEPGLINVTRLNKTDIIANMKRFGQIGDVQAEISVGGTQDEQQRATIAKLIVESCIESGVCKDIVVWETLRQKIALTVVPSYSMETTTQSQNILPSKMLLRESELTRRERRITHAHRQRRYRLPAK